MDFRNKRVLIFGLKRSGRAAAIALHELKADVSITDRKTKEELKEDLKRLPRGITLHLGGHPEEILVGKDLIVLSPGVPQELPIIKKAKEIGIEIIGELELGYLLAKSLNPEVRFHAITGTNGKSTTTALLGLMLKKSGIKSFIAGNYGYALTGELDKTRRAQAVVVEVSSFQLEAVRDFKPAISAILNLAPDHLDRYPSYEDYALAKARIFERQNADDFIVLNADDPETMKLYREKSNGKKGAPKAVFFGRGREVFGVYEEGGALFINLPGIRREFMKASEIKIKGVHNLENSLAASLMAFLAGAPLEKIADVLREFPGLEHRMELVRTVDGVTFINDSKGTNPPATLRSIESFSGSPIVLILGGRDKNGDFDTLKAAVKENARAVVLLGEAKEKIRKALAGATELIEASDLKDAVKKAKNAARQGDSVLFSPACASFDMFRDFEDRGRKFKEEVAGI